MIMLSKKLFHLARFTHLYFLPLQRVAELLGHLKTGIFLIRSPPPQRIPTHIFENHRPLSFCLAFFSTAICRCVFSQPFYPTFLNTFVSLLYSWWLWNPHLPSLPLSAYPGTLIPLPTLTSSFPSPSFFSAPHFANIVCHHHSSWHSQNR